MIKKINKNSFLFFIIDAVIFYTALLLALTLRPNSWDVDLTSFILHAAQFLPLFVLYEVVLYTSGLLDRKFVPSRRKIFDLLLRAHLVATLLMFIYFYIATNIFGVEIEPLFILVIFSVLLFIFFFGWKILPSKTFNIKPDRVLLVGDDQEVEGSFGHSNYLWDMIVAKKISNIEDVNALEASVKRDNIDTIIVDIDNYPRHDILVKLISRQIKIHDLSMIKEELSEKIDLQTISDLWFIKNIKSKEDMFVSAIKRFFDLVLAIPVLLLYGLSFPIISYIVKKDGGSIFFDMPRVGKGGKVFHIRKYRSMSPDPEGNKELVGHTKTVTKIGAFMRKTGLDELPQVMSVIKGDMSFIGPRPEIPSLVEKYTEEIEHYQIRHLVKPGLSGWAQVMQEKAPHHTADVELTREKLAYDLYYIKNHSAFLYLIIVLKTIKSLLNRTNHG